MSERKYTLELTAEELDALRKVRDHGTAVLAETYRLAAGTDQRVFALMEQARADRAQDDLRLPWHAVPQDSDGRTKAWAVRHFPDGGWVVGATACKLMSAAPELLKAVQAVQSNGPAMSCLKHEQFTLIMRALRKVETGVPE